LSDVMLHRMVLVVAVDTVGMTETPVDIGGTMARILRGMQMRIRK